MESYSFVQTIRGSFVQQIEPAKDAMRMDEVVELFSAAFEHVCALKEVDKLVLSSLTRELTMAEMTVPLEKQKRLPNAVLFDHDGQFKEQWKEWCSEPRIDAHFELPSYAQDERRASGASRTSAGGVRRSPLGSFLSGSKANQASAESGSTIHAFMEA